MTNGGWLGAFLELRPLTYLGRISYGVYVYHNFMNFFLPPLTQRVFGIRYFPREWQRVPYYMIVSIAVAAVSYRYFEKPLLAAKKRFAPRA